MGRIPREKKYVAVDAHFHADGRVEPTVIYFDGDATDDYPKAFHIDRILDRCKAASIEVGGAGLRFLVRINGRQSYLYYEPDNKEMGQGRWFVEAKVMTPA